MQHRRFFLAGMVILAAIISPLQAQPTPSPSSISPAATPPATPNAAMEAFRGFVRDVKSGKATFTQVVTSSDGVKKRQSSGTFEFARPNRFRFEYLKPYPQAIVGDGQKLWVHDPDLQQVTVRSMDKALGSTPMALLTGQDFDKDFDVKAEGKADAQGLAWVVATPRTKEGSVFESMRVGFKGKDLAAVEILDALGQRTMLRFDQLVVGQSFGPEHFSFKVPSGTEVVNQ